MRRVSLASSAMLLQLNVHSDRVNRLPLACCKTELLVQPIVAWHSMALLRCLACPYDPAHEFHAAQHVMLDAIRSI